HYQHEAIHRRSAKNEPALRHKFSQSEGDHWGQNPNGDERQGNSRVVETTRQQHQSHRNDGSDESCDERRSAQNWFLGIHTHSLLKTKYHMSIHLTKG